MPARASSVAIAAYLASVGVAQVPQAVPYAHQLDLMVADATHHGVWRLADLNQDGDYNDVGEVTSFYDDAHGSIPLTTPTCVCCAPDGSVFVGDASSRVILRLRDLNGDGDALDPGEATVYFSPANTSGVVMAAVNSITVDQLGRLFLAVANTSTAGNDTILVLTDLNGDGDANDAGEASVYCAIPGSSAAVNDSIPTQVIAGLDGNLYYAESGTTGVVQKGIWRLADTNFDGDCNDPGEVTVYWAPPFVAPPLYYGLATDQSGAFYVTDRSANAQVWRGFDADNSGTIDSTEQTLFYQAAGSNWLDAIVKSDGSILLCDAQNPARITWLHDLNGDGDALDSGESRQVYAVGASPTTINPVAISLQRGPSMEISPPVVQIGHTTSIVAWTARPGDLAAIIMAVAPIPTVSLPPFGNLGVNPFLSAVLSFGLSDSTGVFALSLPVPNSQTAINPYWFQTLAGDPFRLYFSNVVQLTVTP